jgi:hypothetical protein
LELTRACPGIEKKLRFLDEEREGLGVEIGK